LQPLTARATVRAMAAIHMGFIAFTLEAGRFSLAKEAPTMERSGAMDKALLLRFPAPCVGGLRR
jgi:hypothetical protein